MKAVSGPTLSRREVIGSALAVMVSSPATARPPSEGYRNSALPIAVRVRDLLARMTLDEKVAQLRCLWQGKSAIMDDAGHFSPEKASVAIPHGIGQIARPSDFTGRQGRFGGFRDAGDMAAFVNAAQRFSVERTRLGIPMLFHEEMAHGLAVGGGTSFPIPPGLGSTWDPELIEQVFAVAAREARMRGATVALSPVLDLMRDPRWGRMEEFFSEDPYLTGEMGLAAVRGLQGRSRPLRPDKVFATLKHFVHGSPQGGLNIGPADISERTLREVYLPPFERVIRAADPAVVMPSYNEVGGVPAHGDRTLLQDVGRRRLGFTGAYFSDYGGIGELETLHHIAADPDEAALLAMDAGVDADLPEGATYSRLANLVRTGRLEESRIDVAVARILAMKFEAGLFEKPYVDLDRVQNSSGAPAIALARKVAQQSIVLLKNDGLLPLNTAKIKRLAVIGPNAADKLLGGYSGEPERVISILEGVQSAAEEKLVIEHAEGVQITRAGYKGKRNAGDTIRLPTAEQDKKGIAQAVAVASRADAILLVVGDNAQITREATMPTSPGDRSTLNLFGGQDLLVEAMIATGKPLIALLLNGRPLAVGALAEKANALLEGWYLGQEGGNAFADVLFGNVNPSGKLPVSIPRSVGELPAFYNRHPSADKNTYIEAGKKRSALFPFGFGLSYTTFEISAPRLERAEVRAGEKLIFDVDVKNTGVREGSEVVQIYVRDDVSSVPRPVNELKAFRRVTLKAGQSRTLRFELGPEAFALWNRDMKRVVEPGMFTLSSGSSSEQLMPVKFRVIGQDLQI